MKQINCPWCGQMNRIELESYGDDDSEVHECRECDREYVVTVSLRVDVTVSKFDSDKEDTP